MICIMPDSNGTSTGTIADRAKHVRERANWMRRRLLKMIVDAGQGHPGGALLQRENDREQQGAQQRQRAHPGWPPAHTG